MTKTKPFSLYREMRGLSGKYQSILNISRTGGVALMYHGSHLEETLLRIHEQSLSRGASQSAVTRRLTDLVYCVTVAFTNFLPFKGDFSFGEKPEVAESQIWAVGVLTDLGDVTLCQNSMHESCRMGRRIDADSLICSLGLTP